MDSFKKIIANTMAITGESADNTAINVIGPFEAA